jgi:hypothetical protein
LIGAPSAYAQIIHSDHPKTDFKSGYQHGIADASDPCKDPRVPCLAFVWKSPNGFINQTDDFIDGYVVGFCKIAGVNASMDEPEAGFYCSDGPKSANWDIGQTINGHYTSKFPSRNLPSH